MSEDKKKDPNWPDKEGSGKKKHLAQLEKLNEKIAELEQEVGEWKNKYMRVYADMDNARKQNTKDQQYFIKYRAVPFVEKLLPSLDIFATVLRNEPDNEVLKNYLVGFKFVYQHISEALTSEGLKEVEVKVGDKFDENMMQAIETRYAADLPPNTVVSVHNNTYMFLDRLIRPAQVIVSTDKKEETDEKPESEIDPAQMN